jgi:hypothetical protein
MSAPVDVKPPVLQVTPYDKAFAGVIAVFLALAAVCGIVSAVWYANRLPEKVQAVPVELFELPGGFEDGAVDETLRVDSPEPERSDASPVEEVTEQLEIAEALESVTDLSAVSAEPVQQQFETSLANTGSPGSAKGTGRRALGAGGGAAGIPREQRWFVRFGDQAGLDEYARQLDFFGIELGALLPDARLAYLSQLTQPRPNVRFVRTGKDEARLYMTWQGGERRVADVQLFARAQVDVPPGSPMFHFYPPAVENQLAQLERAYRGRPVEQIKRTYFAVDGVAGNYRFSVVRQLYLE